MRVLLPNVLHQAQASYDPEQSGNVADSPLRNRSGKTPSNYFSSNSDGAVRNFRTAAPSLALDENRQAQAHQNAKEQFCEPLPPQQHAEAPQQGGSIVGRSPLAARLRNGFATVFRSPEEPTGTSTSNRSPRRAQTGQKAISVSGTSTPGQAEESSVTGSSSASPAVLKGFMRHQKQHRTSPAGDTAANYQKTSRSPSSSVVSPDAERVSPSNLRLPIQRREEINASMRPTQSHHRASDSSASPIRRQESVDASPRRNRGSTNSMASADSQALIRQGRQRGSNDSPLHPEVAWNNWERQESSQTLLDLVVEAVQDQPWHIVCPGRRDPQHQVIDSSDDKKMSKCFVSSTVVPPPKPRDVPRNAEAVLVLLDIGDQRAARNLVEKLVNTSPRLPPMTVLIMRRPNEPCPEQELVLSTQRHFRLLGADDVIVMQSVGEMLRLDIQLSLQRIAGINEDYETIQKDNHRKLIEHTNNLFWPWAHKCFDGFPEMEENSDQVAPQVGKSVGPYKITERIGKGTFGEVFRTVHETTLVSGALKAMGKDSFKNSDRVKNVWNEFRLLARLRHENIVALIGVMHAQQYIYVMMTDGGTRNLYQVIKEFQGGMPPLLVHTLQVQFASALSYIHSACVAHRDIKPENVAVEGEVIKLVDFGSAVDTNNGRCKDVAGTMPFMAPEVISPQSYLASAADVWSWGVVLLEMVCGISKMCKMLRWERSPAPTAKRAMELIDYFAESFTLYASIQADVGSALDGSLFDLIWGVLQVSPEQRWTSAKVRDCQWMKSPPDCVMALGRFDELINGLEEEA